jgi:hypothetical protein
MAVACHDGLAREVARQRHADDAGRSFAAHVERADSAGKRRSMMLMLGDGGGGSSKAPVDNAP